MQYHRIKLNNNLNRKRVRKYNTVVLQLNNNLNRKRVRKYNTVVLQWFRQTRPTPLPKCLLKIWMTLYSDQSPTATPLLLRVQEQTQFFPRLRIKPVHRSFYEFKSKFNPFHGSGSNRYNCLKLYKNTPHTTTLWRSGFTIFSRNKMGSLWESNNGGF